MNERTQMLNEAELKEHTLNRLGLGVSPAAAARYDELGFDGYVNEQIELANVSANEAEPFLRAARPPNGFAAAAGTESQHRLWEYYQRAHIMRPMVTERRLLDVVTDFWWNHFNVAVGSKIEAATVEGWTDHLPGLAARAMGRFEDLVAFASLNFSMQSYLDNIENSVDEPNENLGREILELHTMGVDSGYSEADVVNCSRILTGWYSTGNDEGGGVGGMYYSAQRHDAGAKVFLGEDFPPNVDGQTEQARLIAMISNHPETYKRISYKLCQKFIADEPPALLVFRGAVVLSETDGDLMALMRHILFSEEFKDRRYYRAKIKRPRHFGASVVLGMDRAINQVDDRPSSTIVIPGVFITYRLKPEAPLLKFVLGCGELLFYNSVPTGYPNVGSYWLSGMTLMRRFEFVAYAAENWMSTVDVANDLATDALINAVTRLVLPGGLTDKSRAEVALRIDAAPPDQRARTATRLVMMTPEFVRF